MAVYDTIAERFQWRTEAQNVQHFLTKLFEDVQLYLDSDFLRAQGVYKCCDDLVYAHLEKLSYPQMALLVYQMGIETRKTPEEYYQDTLDDITRGILNHWLTIGVRFHFHIDPYTDWR
ncbi:MAG: hypothetical protein ACXWQ5_00150 [Ktedonobacterales bacterium]